MPDKVSLNRCREILADHFAGQGAEQLDLPFLYPSEELLNLYGEDLRGRAFLYGDPERGDELCLRPDFTVPVAMTHRERGWARTAMYTYSGPVFRLQPSGENRPVEYLQAGIERFGDPDQAATDAEVFLSLRKGVELLGIDRIAATLGDLSIVIAVLEALEISQRRREALKRHLWRPARFQDLLDRACDPVPVSDARQHLLSQNSEARQQAAEQAGEVVGSRDIMEVLDRLEDLTQRQSEPAMHPSDARLIADVFKVSGPVAGITEQIRELTGPAGIDIETTLERFDARLRHLLEAGCQAGELYFDAAFGRSLEYYDGFVFEIRKAGTDRYPPLAGGGRYNAMTTRLGATEAIPAVGGIVRPEAVLDCLL